MSTSCVLLLSVTTITLALICYTVAVWSTKIQKQLRLWHVIMFCLGFCADTTGTLLMSRFAHLSNSHNQLHSITGMIALGLMLIGASWAAYAYFRGSEKARQMFSKISIPLWFFWLSTYFMGMFIGMGH